MKTLKEKFLDANINSVEFAWMDTEGVEECVDIAEEFAIGFAEWVTINYPNQRKFLLRQGNLMGFYTTKELLEIYKKEKGLC